MDSLYDCALSEVGLDGKYQKNYDVIYNVVFSGLWIMAYYNIIIALTIPPHACKLPNKPDNVSENLWKMKYIPTVKDAAGEEKISDCLIYADSKRNNTKGCDFYEYETNWFETTIPSENNWVCENDLYVSNIIAYGRIGEIVGSLFFGWFGDIYGRKPTYIISLCMLIIGRAISLIASSSYVLFTIGCIIASFPSWSATQSTAIISLEITSSKRRATVATSRLVATSFGMCLMALVYWWFRNWRPFFIITTATQLPYLLLCWKMIESPQWLWVNRKTKECVNTFKQIAKVNETKLSPDIEHEILTSAHVTTNNTEVLGPLSLFAGWRLAMNTILQLLLWITVSTNYSILMISFADNSNGNPYLSLVWQCLAEIPGYFVASWLADRIGRRYTGMISSLLTTFIWMVYGYREINKAAWLRTEWLSSFLVITIRMTSTMTYYIINLFNMELYPTCLRQSGMSLGNVFSGGGGVLAPYIFYLGHRYDTRYPSAIMIAITLAGGVLSSFLLPETLNVKLPETLADAQKFGRRGFDRTYYSASKHNEEVIDLNTPS